MSSTSNEKPESRPDRTGVGPTPWASDDPDPAGAGDDVRDGDASRRDANGSDSSDRGRSADDPTEIPAAGWKDIALRIKDEFKEDHVTLTAAGVAFFFFLALAPLLAAGVSIYGLVADPKDVESLVDRLGPSVPEAVANLIGQQLETVSSAAGGALGIGVLIGIASALWSASSGFGHLIEGLNIAYDEEESRGFVAKKLLSLGLTVGFLVLLGAVIGTVTVATGLATGVAKIISLVVGWIIVAVLFGLFLAVLYRYGPSRDEPQWSWVSPGSIFAVVAWTLMSVGFGFYVSRFGSYNETYGSLGAIVVTLTWMYLTAAIVVIGAEITTELERQTAKDSTDGSREPMGERDAAAADELGAAAD